MYTTLGTVYTEAYEPGLMDCPHNLRSFISKIASKPYYGTNLTIPDYDQADDFGSDVRKLVVFPRIPCAYWKHTGEKKFDLRDMIPAFEYLKLSDSRKVLRSIANDISHFGNNCQRNSGTTSNDFLGIQIIQLRPTDFWKKYHFFSGVKDEIFKVFESKQVDLFDADFLDVLGEPWEKNARIETILGFLRFKCSGSDVMFVETKSMVTFYRTVKRNILLVYVYGGRVRRVRLMNE